LLLAAGADPNHTWDPKKTLLSVAVEAANLAAVRLLLQAGAAVKAHLPGVLYYPIARLAGNSKQKAQFRRQYLELLLHERPDLLRYSYNASSECLLDYLDHFIGYCPEVAVLKWLLQQGADVNTQQAAGNTPLHLLILSLIKSLYDDDAYELWLPAIRVLMQAGANPKITNAAGQSVYALIRSNAAAFTATQLQQLRLILDKQEHLMHGPYPWEQHKYPAIKKQLAVERAELAAVAAAARAVAATTAHAADGAAETKGD
ncbi:MAG TPA: hypothetical protein VJJ83_02230, partial [Candidatus Babeliales bacterium]|nr:hypothetical protein [Candidatus Babeliales bacterium]